MAYGNGSRLLGEPSQAFHSLGKIIAKLSVIKTRDSLDTQLETHSKITLEEEQKQYVLEDLVQSTVQPFSDLKACGSCIPDSVTQPVC